MGYEFKTDERKIPEFLAWLQEEEEAGKIEIIRRERMGNSINEAWGNIYVRPRRTHREEV